MSPPSSSISPSLPPRSHLFTPIHEGNETEDSETERHRFDTSSTPTSSHHNPTPLHHQHQQPVSKKPTRKPKPDPKTPISCTNCRPTPKSNPSSVMVVPINHTSLSSTSSPSPNNLFKSLINGISRRTPKQTAVQTTTPPPCTVAEISHKLLQATRRRDEAILEASRLKYSMNELENKLTRLENYCYTLKNGLDQAQTQAQTSGLNIKTWSLTSVGNNEIVVSNFLVAVSEARSSVRFLSNSVCSQLKLMGGKVFERLSVVLKSYDFKLSPCLTASNFKTVQFYLEAVLNAAFYTDFETSGFVKGSMDRVLNPVDKCGSNYSAYNGLKDLTWDQVLNKGTKHFSEEFSGFCDRKMGEIVGLLGWNRAWPEKLLQAFFGAAKRVWLVHLLANSVHPRLVIFRVGKGVRFDPVYMEDMGCGNDKGKKLIPTTVKVMVTPGFYVYDNVVKCKVISKYYNYNYDNNSGSSNYGSSVFSGNDE